MAYHLIVLPRQFHAFLLRSQITLSRSIIHARLLHSVVDAAFCILNCACEVAVANFA